MPIPDSCTGITASHIIHYHSHVLGTYFHAKIRRAWVKGRSSSLEHVLPHSLDPGRGEEHRGQRMVRGGGSSEGGGGSNKQYFPVINLCVITVQRQRTVYEPGDLFFSFLFFFLFFLGGKKKATDMNAARSLRARPLVCAAAPVGEMKINSGGSSVEMRHCV